MTKETFDDLYSWPGKRFPTRDKNKDLMYDASMAIAWGRPDSESTGYSASEFIDIIQRLVKRVEELEKQLG